MKCVVYAILAVLLIPLAILIIEYVRLTVIAPWLFERRTALAEETNEEEWQTGQVMIYRVNAFATTEQIKTSIASDIACARKWVTAQTTLKNGAVNRFEYFGLNETHIGFPVSELFARSFLLDVDGICRDFRDAVDGMPQPLLRYHAKTGNTAFFSTDPTCFGDVDAREIMADDVEFTEPVIELVGRVPLKSVLTREAYAPEDTRFWGEFKYWHPDLDAARELEDLARSICD